MRERYSGDEYYNPDHLHPDELSKDVTAKSDALVARVRLLLAGQQPLVIGSALGELLATFVAAHAPQLREVLLDSHFKFVREMMVLVETQMRKDGRWPTEWDEPN